MRPSFCFIAVLVALASTSCASIFTRSIYPVDFNSSPQGAELTVESRDGRTVFLGRTPATVYLESSAGYMRPEHYKITYRQPDGEPVTTWIDAKIDGWYFGNLLWCPAAWIGMLLVDPLTGAMWKIPPGSEFINVTLETPAVTPLLTPVPDAPAASAAPTAPIGEWSPLGE